jgi:beta-mannosidase
VTDLDGKAPYWPGGPFGGNVHYWGVWYANFSHRFGEEARTDPTPENVYFLRYAEDTGRFISEFGVNASPVYETPHHLAGRALLPQPFAGAPQQGLSREQG